MLAALEDASDGIQDRAAYCPACASRAADLCDEDAYRLPRADAYDRPPAQVREAT